MKCETKRESNPAGMRRVVSIPPTMRFIPVPVQLCYNPRGTVERLFVVNRERREESRRAYDGEYAAAQTERLSVIECYRSRSKPGSLPDGLQRVLERVWRVDGSERGEARDGEKRKFRKMREGRER